MQLVLAIDADRKQADQLAALIGRRLAVELVQATSAGEALQALGERVPDLILTSPLLSPFDEGVLAEFLREIGPAGAHVQTLRIPVLGVTKERGRSLFSFGRKRRTDSMPDGCDPTFFIDEIAVYLARAAEERQPLETSSSPTAFDVPAEPGSHDVPLTYVPAYEPEPYTSHNVAEVTDDDDWLSETPIYVPPAPPGPVEQNVERETAHVAEEDPIGRRGYEPAAVEEFVTETAGYDPADAAELRKEARLTELLRAASIAKAWSAATNAPRGPSLDGHIRAAQNIGVPEATEASVTETGGYYQIVDRQTTHADDEAEPIAYRDPEGDQGESVAEITQIVSAAFAGEVVAESALEQVEPPAAAIDIDESLSGQTRESMPPAKAAPGDADASSGATTTTVDQSSMVDEPPHHPATHENAAASAEVMPPSAPAPGVEPGAILAPAVPANAPPPTAPQQKRDRDHGEANQPAHAAAPRTPRRSASFEAALAAIRNAWGNKRRTDPPPTSILFGATRYPEAVSPSEGLTQPAAIQAQDLVRPPAQQPEPIAEAEYTAQSESNVVESQGPLEVDLTGDIEALEDPLLVAPVAQEAADEVTTEDVDVYELSASPALHDLEADLALAAPPRVERPVLPELEPEEPEEAEARSEATGDGKDPSRKSRKRSKKRQPPKPPKPNTRPIQDEWGMFDPSRCGFAAVVQKLNEVTDEEDQKGNNRTSVRIISFR